jgi:[ribosomal protein S5]-alanine N-acetyltransferase
VRLPEQRDADHIAAYYTRNKRHLAEFSPVPDELCSAGFWHTRVEQVRHEFLDDRSCKTFIFDRDDTTVIGTATLSEFVRGPFQAGYLGFSLAEERQGQGLMHAALSPLLAFAFTKLNLHRIMANYMPRNSRSAAVLERLGFAKEGIAKQYLLINGVWEDHVLTSFTNPRWTSGAVSCSHSD